MKPESMKPVAAPESGELEDDLDAEIESDVKLPSDAERALEEDEPEGDTPEYGDLIDSGWLERATGSEDLDDDRGGSLEVGITLDLSQWDSADELGQGVDLDIGPLLSVLPVEAEPERDGATREPGGHDPSFATGALSELLLPDAAEPEALEEEVVDEQRFPAFDETTLPLSRRPEPDASEPEGLGDHEGPEQ